MAFKKVIVDYLGKLAEMLGADTIDPVQLGTGTPDGTKFLRDDGTWQTPAGGGGGGGTVEIEAIMLGYTQREINY